jgi:hypothetical protein
MAMRRQTGSVEEYLAERPDEAHAILEKVRRASERPPRTPLRR